MPSVRDNLAVCLLDAALERGLGDRVALREGPRAWTYAELADRVARTSAVLAEFGLGAGERVAILMRDSLDAAAAILGAIHAGCVAVPLSELARPLDVREYLADAGAVIAIVDIAVEPTLDAIRTELPGVREVLCAGDEGDIHRPGVRSLDALVARTAPAPSAAAVSPRDPAMIAYSIADREQGVRGVPHTHATPMEAVSCFARGVLAMDETDRVLSLVRMSTTYGLGASLVFPLAVGAESLLLPEQPRSDAIFAAVASVDPTVVFATPSVYSQLAHDVADDDAAGTPLVRVRACVSGAEGMPPKLIPRIKAALGAEVVVGYGLTEAFQFVLVGTAGEGRLGACGRPVPGFEARILDDDGTPVGPDVIGTLQIRGPTLFASYWEGDDPLDDGWFTTRDRFMMDEHGNFYHCGREDDAFKVGGKWVAPSEVERALLSHEAVWECAVIGAEDEDGLHKPLAFVVPNVGHEPSEYLEGKLRSYVKDVLAPYKYPRWIEFVGELPRGPHGKLLRYKLRPPEHLAVESADEG